MRVAEPQSAEKPNCTYQVVRNNAEDISLGVAAGRILMLPSSDTHRPAPAACSW